MENLEPGAPMEVPGGCTSQIRAGPLEEDLLVARCLRWDGVSLALRVGSVRLSLAGMSHAIPCVRTVPPSSEYSTMLEIQKPGQTRLRQAPSPAWAPRRYQSPIGSNDLRISESGPAGRVFGRV